MVNLTEQSADSQVARTIVNSRKKPLTVAVNASAGGPEPHKKNCGAVAMVFPNVSLAP